MTGDREPTELFWEHLYGSCVPQFCVWCSQRQEFVKWSDQGEANDGD